MHIEEFASLDGDPFAPIKTLTSVADGYILGCQATPTSPALKIEF
ncbi:hypothetical protein [Rhodococcus jostii]|nr:hypothetical protein [Rhodococcus jostii]